MKDRFSLHKIVAISATLALTISLNACTYSTGNSGAVMSYTEGVIKDIEVIDMDKNHTDKTTNTAIGAVGGAVAGQLIGKDTKGTLIGAGIGAGIGLLGSFLADRGQGMRLTVSTDTGNMLVDQPYSCMFHINDKIRMINQQDGSVQVQVYRNGSYQTVSYSNNNEKCD